MTRLQDQFNRGFLGDAWHGDAVFDVLATISAEQAVARPVGGGHSIEEIVRHMSAWMTNVRLRSAGEADGTATDWPSGSGTAEESWAGAVTGLRADFDAMGEFLAGLTDAQLGREVAGTIRTYSVYQDLHGVLQHTLYHLGQIVLLKKLTEADG
ncbi:MAG: DinB family protein [Longimicrobiales bacterium]